MITINIEVSDMLRTRLFTGIQRVMREVVPRLISASDDGEFRVRFLRFDPTNHSLDVLTEASMTEFFVDPSKFVETESRIEISSLGSRDIFFDLDSSWNSALRRSALYAMLNQQDVRIVTYIYDLVPVKFPRRVHSDTLRNWLTFISAVLTYSDLVITDSRAAEIDFLDLKESMQVIRHIPTVVTKLGSDIAPAGDPTPEELKSTTVFRTHRYLLFVGTIEPRKQQLKALKAFELLMPTHPDLHLVFAGRQGWDSKDAVAKIRGHTEFGKRVHWVDSPSEELLQHLYAHAFACLYLSQHEGFGLPVAESLGYGKVTVTSRNSSLYEVAAEAADYTYFDTPAEVAGTVQQYLGDADLLRARENYIAHTYRPYSWDLVSRTIIEIFSGLDKANALQAAALPTTLQFVLISNGPEKLAGSISMWDSHAPFVSEYLVICPRAQVDEIASIRSSRVITVLADEDVLSDRLELFRSADRQGRDWLLRSALAGIDGVADEFVMLDDDYLPLRDLAIDTFIGEDRSYNAYFYNDLLHWPHQANEYDEGQRATKAVLDAAGLELTSYSSHQPQIINKALLAESVAFVESGASHDGLDAWSIYFNYAATRYPTLITKRIYETLNWPAYASDWTPRYPPTEYAFENYYAEAIPHASVEQLNQPAESVAKVSLRQRECEPYLRSEQLFDESRGLLEREGLARGPVRFMGKDVAVLLAGLPQVITMAPNSTLWLEVGVQLRSKRPASRKIGIYYRLLDKTSLGGVSLRSNADGPFTYEANLTSLPVIAGEAGTYDIEFYAEIDGQPVFPRGAHQQAKLIVVPEGVSPISMYHEVAIPRRQVSGSDPQRRPKSSPVRRLGKRAIKGLLPSLVNDRLALHETARTVARLDRRIASLQESNMGLIETVEYLERRLLATTEATTKRIDRISSHLRGAKVENRIVRLRTLLQRVEHYQPVYGISGLVELPARPSIDRAIVVEQFIGSSLGYMSFYFADRGARVQGWDVSAGNVEVARAISEITGISAGFKVKALDIDSVATIHEGRFDVALLLSVLHHIIFEHGLAAAQEIVEGLLARVPVLIVELATKAEDPSLPWSASQPESALEVLAKVRDDAEITKLGEFSTHLSADKRSLYSVVRKQVVVVNDRPFAYDRLSSEAYPGSPMARRDGLRRFYFGPQAIVKEYQYALPTEQEFRQSLNEINTHVNLLTPASVWHSAQLLDFELSPGIIRIAFQPIPGTLLTELGRVSRQQVTKIASDLLRTLADLQGIGLFHNDVRSWNVIVGDDGESWLIDYGLASHTASEDSIVAFVWVLHAALTGERESSSTSKTELPDRDAFAADGLLTLWDDVASGVRDAQQLLRHLSAQPRRQKPGPSSS
jgi:glycosyltransferase involved in cell wall biosynthesis